MIYKDIWEALRNFSTTHTEKQLILKARVWGRTQEENSIQIMLDDLKERRGYSHLKEEALDRTMCRARFGRGFGPVVRQTTK